MIKLSNLADYAVALMGVIAQRPDHIHSSAEINQKTEIPLPTVSKIMGVLTRFGLLRSHRGFNGGFSLAKQSDEITIADIIEAVDGPVQLTNCIGTEGSDCDWEAGCATRGRWDKINDAVKEALQSVTLTQMVSPMPDFVGDKDYISAHKRLN